MDLELVRQCADDSLQPAIVERFIEAVGVESPLAVTVTTNGKILLVPTPKTTAEAVETIRQHVGEAIVRVGLTKFPAGVGAAEDSQIYGRLVDPCENIKLGTTLFAKIYGIVTNWYGGFMPEAFDDAVQAYGSGYFEGKYVFGKADPGSVDLSEPEAALPEVDGREVVSEPGSMLADDPFKAETRIDLGRIQQTGSFDEAAYD